MFLRYFSILFVFGSYGLILVGQTQAQDSPPVLFKITDSISKVHSLLYFTKLNLIMVDNGGEGRGRSNITLVATPPTDIQFNETEGKFMISADMISGTPASDLTVSKFNLTVAMKILYKSYWAISNFQLTASGTVRGQSFDFKDTMLVSSTIEPSAPLKMSFHCSKFGPWTGITQGNFTPQVEFSSFQMEGFMKDNSKFGPSYDCVGFFSIGIWSGIFVTIILLSILSWSITMVMSVKTMDRFDDAKSKPISVGGLD